MSINPYLVAYFSVNDNGRRQMSTFTSEDYKTKFDKSLKGYGGNLIGDWYALPNDKDVDDAINTTHQLGGTVVSDEESLIFGASSHQLEF
ncbi:hypothetical protein F5J12DRAFT_889486 [Pisolithus orientalis]|uniref:uncharacterized protein n=1 Tax=Pisolithus orientalis TaxID=936130 RepID=UPI0022258498|nr:uncharacterized protein F5J12DRAFT_889486 [Pisolithus orientalis]KAI6025601.1 hypothetical protein F5J12DRAFT_889486 [Pisolithus orientalis]